MSDSPIGSVADDKFDKKRDSIKADFEKKHEELRKVSALFKTTILHCRTNGFASHEALWNIALHINMVAHDLSVLVEDLVFERDNWKRRLAARHIALVCYEAAEDMQQLTGKPFRQALGNLGVLNLFEATIKEARKPLVKFWDEHHVFLQQIRVSSAAHRDSDALVVLDTVENIKIDTILDLGFELGKILIELGAAFQSILNETSSITPPEL